LPSRQTPSVTVVPGAVCAIALRNATVSLTGLPSRLMMMSPGLSPALAAGPSGDTSCTSAPFLLP
jgi:hypothetical protein